MRLPEWVVAIAELEIELEKQVEAIAPTCNGCSHFQGDTPFTGMCDRDQSRVLRIDRICDFYHKPIVLRME